MDQSQDGMGEACQGKGHQSDGREVKKVQQKLSRPKGKKQVPGQRDDNKIVGKTFRVDRPEDGGDKGSREKGDRRPCHEGGESLLRECREVRWGRSLTPGQDKAPKGQKGEEKGEREGESGEKKQHQDRRETQDGGKVEVDKGKAKNDRQGEAQKGPVGRLRRPDHEGVGQKEGEQGQREEAPQRKVNEEPPEEGEGKQPEGEQHHPPEKEGEKGHVLPRNRQKVRNPRLCKVLPLLLRHESCVREEKGGEEACRLPGKCGEEVGQELLLSVVESSQKIPARGESSGHGQRKTPREDI